MMTRTAIIQSEEFPSRGKKMKRQPPDHKLDSDLHEAFAVAIPPGPVVSIKPDPRKQALEDAKDFEIYGHKRKPLRNLTDRVRERIRERINGGHYDVDPLQVLCNFAADENLSPELRIQAAKAAAEYLHTKRSQVKVFDEAREEAKELAAETSEAKKKRLAAAVRAMLEPPKNVEN
jgi:hypothetical protein